MGAKSNLLIYLKKKNISKPDFYKKTGLSNGFLDKNEGINSDKIEIIINNFSDLSLSWLITGRGEMILNSSEIEQNTVQEEKIEYGKKDIVAEYLIKRINDLEKEVEDLKGKINTIDKPEANSFIK